MKRCAILALLVGLIMAPGLVPGLAADEPGQAIDSEAAELVAEMADLLDQALYLAIAALSWPDKDDLTLYIQGVINLLDGPSSPHYDATGGATTPDGDGLKDLLLEFQTAGWTTTEMKPIALRPSLIVQVAQAMEHLERFVFMAAEAAKDALARVYSVTEGRQELRAMYAYLFAARGQTDDELVLGGVSALVETFPSLDLRVEPTLSLQATIDRAPPGATIHLDPGTYYERIVIDKDLTLVGAPSPEPESGLPTTAITGAAWDFVVSIEGDGVSVCLENLAISGGLVGVAMSGPSQTRLESVVVLACNTATTLYNDASMSCHSCDFSGQELGMILRSGSEAQVSDSAFRDGGIVLMPDSTLHLTDSTVSACNGHGIYLQGDSALHLEGCSIYDNEGFGVLGYSADCVTWYPSPEDAEDGFTGTITGLGNSIPGPDEEHGNREGDVCPEAYRFLKEPGQVDVLPGASIQAAVDAAVEGATVLISVGTYRESLEIGKPVVLRGEGDVVLVAETDDAPAILVSETSGVELRDLEFGWATGVEIHNASCRVVDCMFRTTNVGASVIAFGENTVDFETCAFSGEGTGVRLLGEGSVGIDECRFSGFSVGVLIGGMVSTAIRASSFENCTEGVALASSASATIEDSRFRGCILNGVRVSQAPLGTTDGALTLNANVFSDGSGWDISLCGLEGIGELQFLGSLSGSGNVVEGGTERLCPADYDWPDGFLDE